MSAVSAEIHERFKLSCRHRGLPPHLVGTDRVLARWAVSIGDGTTDLRWHEIAKCQIPPLDDQMAIVVDKLILRAPTRTRQITEIWYRKQDPVSEIARRLGVAREMANCHHELCLEYFRGHFLSSPLSGLRFLASVDPNERLDELA